MQVQVGAAEAAAVEAEGKALPRLAAQAAAEAAQPQPAAQAAVEEVVVEQALPQPEPAGPAPVVEVEAGPVGAPDVGAGTRSAVAPG